MKLELELNQNEPKKDTQDASNITKVLPYHKRAISRKKTENVNLVEKVRREKKSKEE